MLLLNGYPAIVGLIFLFTYDATAKNDGKEYQSCHYLESTDKYVCYSLFDDYKNWTQAKDKCESLNKKMARPTTAQRNGWIANLQRKARTPRAWFAVRESGQSWDELSKVDKFVGWGYDKPDNRLPYEACAVLESTNKFAWDDRRCTQEHGFICSLGISGSSKCNGSMQVLTRNGCLQVYNNSVAWFSARAECRDYGGNLALVTSKETQQSLVKFLTKIKKDDMNFWINFIRRQWKWVDTGTDLDFFAWENGQPNLEDQSCVAMVTKGTWLDLHCTDKIPFVCESYTTSPSVPADQQSDKLSLASPLLIFGVVVTVLVVVFCIVLTVGLLRNRRKKKEEERRVYMLEQDPRYADRVILTRAPRFTPTSYATGGQWVWKETDPTNADTLKRRAATDA